ncbi:MAG TPA: CHASE4 domain-containing protein [Steroidobacteraceae bacterium]|nr:CHASE4 domain-containing protein [Steroidobacteraceae bacterium]
MTIRSKVVAVLIALFVALGAVQWTVQHLYLLPSFVELERDSARTDMRRVQLAIDRELEQLDVAAMDWGNWGSNYQFMLDRNKAFASANLRDSALIWLKIDYLALVDMKGDIVWSRALQPGTSRIIDLGLDTGGALPADHPWRVELAAGKATHGLLDTARGPMLGSAAPIVDGFGKGKPHGMVIMGRLLSADEVARLGSQAQAALHLAATAAGAPDESITADAAATHVDRVFRDIRGHGLMTLRVDVPHTISRRGAKALSYSSTLLLGTGVGVLLLMIVLVHSVVLKPLARVTRHAELIGSGEDLSARLNLERRDEIGVLAREFDRMVAHVAEVRRRLIDQSFEAGIAEQASGVLHNVGNAITPLAVRIASLQSRLDAAPVADLERVFAELADPLTDPGRRADLEDFLRLAGAELLRAVRGAEDDLQVIGRQTGVLETVLAQQSRRAGASPVIESVRLDELITNSLELVPEEHRRRLTLRLDESVAALGVLRLPRGTLQMIFQNLIINAAEALPAVGRARGTLQVSAGLLSGAGQRGGVRLVFKDNGHGLSPEQLARVFERGFSTKGGSGNSGIGLHWCANALHAMGGSIRMDSDGPGLGASVELVVPLAELAVAHAA